ncbi:nitronate monooxygenase [Thermosyntropha sp.]|uniref:NAD(P)H-dependent flavin oxidoreductase n=1 Tax=Thermosyntropha sp. TaxID=2740820 RepID=UPI0025CE73B0|nr:nitronate monooxygenase [Thermosyntropha sp.]MBO8158779.1 nitronate monooxygenase [Thermosyntropha sp.]
MQIKTRITELFGIEYPIICGGMLWLATPELCAAISNAGGLGNITACNYNTGEELREAIQKARQLTDKPIGVNITLLPSMRFTEEIFDDFFKVCAEEKVEVIEVSGKPATKYLDMLHKAGVKVMHKVGAVRHAKNIERYGYDAVIAAGIEEGGHPLNDDVTTMVLLPRIVESVRIPVIATGGIATGKQMAAALTLGAEGVLMATRFIATKECQVHPKIWEELIKREEYETTLICKSVGLQGRALKNKLTEQVLEIEARSGDLMEIIPLLSGQRAKEAWTTGEVDNAALMVGQSIGMIKEVLTCEELITSMVKEAKETFEKQLARFS